MKLVFVVKRDNHPFAYATNPTDLVSARKQALDALIGVASFILTRPGIELSIDCEMVPDDWQIPGGC